MLRLPWIHGAAHLLRFPSGKFRAGRWGGPGPLLGVGQRCILGTLTQPPSLDRLTGSPGATSSGSSRAASMWWLWTCGDTAPLMHQGMWTVTPSTC